jgi:putative oxidoreductase
MGFYHEEGAMIRKLFQTNDDIVPLVLRVFLGFLILPHCMQKLLGWYGGEGFAGTMAYLTGMGMPALLAFLDIMCEPLACLGLIPGFMTRIAAALVTIEMTVAIFMIHLPYGLFMNWNGKQAGEGFEYNLLVIIIAIALLIKGGGKWSIDKAASDLFDALFSGVSFRDVVR